MSNDQVEKDLDKLLKQLQDKSWATFLPDELKLLIEAFLPDLPHTTRSKAYIVLSVVCQRLRDSHPPTKDVPEAATEAISRVFSPAVTARLSDTVEREALSGLCFLAALFQVDWQSAAAILQHDGVVESIADSLELFPSSPSISRAVAQLVSQAAGHKSCRAIIPRQCVEWLETKARRSDDSTLQAAAAVALVKLSRGASADAASATGADKIPQLTGDDALVKMMKGLVVSEPDASSLNDAIEGLAYMSTGPSVREALSKDTQFLARLFAVIPRRKGLNSQPLSADSVAVTPIYGTVLIISNICAYKPRLSEEEAQIAKLKRMANAKNEGKLKEPENDALEDDDHANTRCKRLLAAGVVDALTAAVRFTDSKATRLITGKALLSIVEDQENRGKVLQAGGARALITIIQGLLPPPKKSTPSAEDVPTLERPDIEPIQALAKLAITASPLQVFGPNEGALYDAIRPFAIMLLHPNSNLLQRFEAMMALTNLSSQSAEVADRVAKAGGLMNKVELLMLEDHTLVRRAATELVCNLISGCEDVFNRYGGEKSGASKSKLHVLLALCDVDDLPTRLAASGALAVVSASPDACQSLLELQREKKRVLPVLGQLIDPAIEVPHMDEDGEAVEEIKSPGTQTADPDPGLVHRGVVCIRNFFVGLDSTPRKEVGEQAQEVGLTQALIRIFREGANNPASPVVRPAAEALKSLMESGLQLSLS
ncbi:hypothetical protein EIP86_003304 [Pleurotus ostreatoroseus]|nr:hypothetical protein EIP86_003304 [Pleurotus ostreatoroseus]